MTAVAVIGLGAMGAPVARRFLDAGHDVVVWNRTAERASKLAELGATPAASPAEAARRSEVVVTMVSDRSALREVTEGPSGLAAGLDTSATLVQMSTVGAAAVLRLAELLPDGASLLDAPVLGSLPEAESGNLRIFVGGDASLLERLTPLLSVLGTPMHVGPLGSGSAAKLVANSTLFGVLGVLGETIALADAVGLSRRAAYDVLAVTPIAEQAARRRDSIESGEYPPRFTLSLARKDADLIADAATAAGLDLRLASAARSWLQDAQEAGLGDSDYSAMLGEILRPR